MGKIKQYEIVVGLSLAGSSVAQIARDLGCSHSWVSTVIKGKAESEKVLNYIRSKSKRVKIIEIDEI